MTGPAAGPVTLVAGDLRAAVDPSRGGLVTEFTWQGRDLFVPVDAASGGRGSFSAGGCFPLVPWSNRIRDARLRFGGRDLALEVTEPERGHAIHGHGVWRAWSCKAGGASATLRFDHAAGDAGWPWSYTTEQVLSLTADRLAVSLKVENRDVAPMPVGIGLHPYFPRRSETRLQFDAATAWPPQEAEKFPLGGGPLPSHLDRHAPGPIPFGLDQGFGGWGGRARVEWPDQGVAVRLNASAPLDHLIVYTPVDAGYFCIEPVSHAIDAANLAPRGVPETGHRVLAPGETLSATVEFIVEVS